MNVGDIFAEARSLVDATATSLPDAVLLRRINQSNEEIVSLILQADGTWQFDDANFTTNPTGYGNLTEAVNKYTFSNDFLDIEEVSILTLDNLYKKLKPIDPSQLGNMSFEEYFNITFDGTNYTAQLGTPEYYDKYGKTIVFDKAPSAANCVLTNGLRVRFSRTADLFTTGDVTAGTKSPGFAINHIVLAYKMALPYAVSYKKDRVSAFVNEISRLTNGIIDHYSMREKDKRKIMTKKQIIFR